MVIDICKVPAAIKLSVVTQLLIGLETQLWQKIRVIESARCWTILWTNSVEAGWRFQPLAELSFLNLNQGKARTSYQVTHFCRMGRSGMVLTKPEQFSGFLKTLYTMTTRPVVQTLMRTTVVQSWILSWSWPLLCTCNFHLAMSMAGSTKAYQAKCGV